MDLLIGSISAICILVAFTAYKKTKIENLKRYCLLLPILILLIAFNSFLLVKWYEVPIHYSRISYLFSRNASPYTTYEGNTIVNVTYDYNSYKGIKDFWCGFPIEPEPGIHILTCLKGKDRRPRLKAFEGGTSFSNDTSNVLKKIMDYGEKLIMDDKDYLEYLQSENITPYVSNRPGGALLGVDINCSNRQFLSALSFYNSHKSDCLFKDTVIFSQILVPHDSLSMKYDSLRISHMKSYFVPYNKNINSTRYTSYTFTPNTDSVVYQDASLIRNEYYSPNYFWTAEDISRAVEIISFRGLKDNLCLKSLSFDYVGPTEFSKMYPEPDIITVSKIKFTDLNKLKIIRTNGLRFHVKFPDLENVQQIRMFLVTIILSGLLAKLVLMLYNIIKECYYRNYFKCIRINKRIILICYCIFIVVLFLILFLIIYHSKVDSLDIDNESTFTIISDID